VQSPVQMVTNFLMDRDPVGAGFSEVGNVAVWIFDHQVAVERQLRGLPQRLHYWWADGDVGDEMSVHDIDVNERGSAFGSAANLLRQMGEVRRENRRCQFDQTWDPTS